LSGVEASEKEMELYGMGLLTDSLLEPGDGLVGFSHFKEKNREFSFDIIRFLITDQSLLVSFKGFPVLSVAFRMRTPEKIKIGTG